MVYVILFLIDGLGYHYIDSLKGFAYDIKNQKPFVTGPNWITILTGKKVKDHKVICNEQISKRSFYLSDSTIFDDDWDSSWFISDWNPLLKVSNRKNLRKIYNKKVFEELKNWKKYKPHLTIVNTDIIDSVAHKYGWNSKNTLKRIHFIENEIMNFYSYMKIHCEKEGSDFVIFVTADHGGYGNEHDENNEFVTMVPWISLTELNQKVKKIKHTYQIRDLLKEFL
jgi:predicted AlkP superfamily pyrophosphatase or phosphodiesterase